MDLLHQSAYKILDTDPAQKKLLPQDLQELLETLDQTRYSSPDDVKCQYCGEDTIYHLAKECNSHEFDEVIKEVGKPWSSNNKYEMGSLLTYCVSMHAYEENWFVCQECDAFHLQCPKCVLGAGSDWMNIQSGAGIQLCRFLGFEGVFYKKDLFTKGIGEIWNIRLPSFDILARHYPKYFPEFKEKLSIRTPSYRNHAEFAPPPVLNEVGISQFLRDYPNAQDEFPPYYVGDLNRYYASHADDNTDYRETLNGPEGESSHHWKCPRCQTYYHIFLKE